MQRAAILRFVVLASVCLGLVACGGPQVVDRPIRPVPKKVEPPKPIDLSAEGVPRDLNTEIDVKGYQTIWIRDTKLLCTLLKTQWDQIGDEADADREAWMVLECTMGAGKSRVRLDVGESKPAFGFTIKATYAYEYYNDKKGTHVPHAKFTITK